MDETLFGRKTLKAAPKIFKNNRPEIKKVRKERKDKQHDIKFRLSLNDKKLLKLKAMNQKMSVTKFASLVVKKDLILDREYSDYEYDNEGIFVHASLEGDYFEMLKTLAIEWNMPYRKVVHRIIKEYLAREYGGLTIHYYNDPR
ncbi:hypothetical protein P9265_14660 [Schinkia azotoformans]|uniref:hypothetical protein n=1 Tax=Schinkia azotoformans TaxID=1454 RepID=UPI002E1C99DF|nr:hypothetical protein [Schinkia azotoformans]